MTWIRPTDYLNYKDAEIFKMKTMYQYLSSVYHSVLMLGFNEMGPVNELEMVFAAMSMLVASFFNAQIFSEMAVLIYKI